MELYISYVSLRFSHADQIDELNFKIGKKAEMI